MQPCLNIAEIVEVIVQNADTKTDFLTMARICRALYEPAMNMLWRDLVGIKAIICCLPEGMYGYTGDKWKKKGMLRTPSAADWARFKHHAPRVKIWHIPPRTYLDQADYSCLEAMRSSFPRDKVFPNLRHFGCEDRGMAPYFDMCILPSLHSVHGLYARGRDEEPAIRFLDIIATVKPSLRTIQLHAHEGDTPEMAAALSRALCSQSHLTTLKIGVALPDNVLNHVGTLPGLEHLSLSLEKKNYKAMFAAFKIPQFVALRYLKITSCALHVGPLAGFLRGIAPRELLDLALDLSFFHNAPHSESHHPTSAFLRTLYAAVAAVHPHLSLCVSAASSHGTVMPEYVATLSTFQPLLHLTTLKRLDARVLPFCLHPDDFKAIAHALPTIEELNLGQDTKVANTSAQPRDLIHFARHCPKLRTLSLPFRCDFNEVPALAGPRHGNPEHNLRELGMGESNAPYNPTDFAAFVFEIFPHAEVTYNLDNLDPTGGYRPRWVDRVEMVQETLLELKAARWRERNSSVHLDALDLSLSPSSG